MSEFDADLDILLYNGGYRKRKAESDDDSDQWDEEIGGENETPASESQKEQSKVQEQPEKVKKKRNIIKVTDQDLMQCIFRMKNDVLGGLHHLAKLSAILNDNLVQCTSLSIFPTELSNTEFNDLRQRMLQILRWIQRNFRKIDDMQVTIEEGRLGIYSRRSFENLCRTKAGPSSHAIQLISSLLRIWNIRHRIVQCIIPRLVVVEGDDDCSYLDRMWIEYFEPIDLEGHGTWIAIDPSNNTIDCSDVIMSALWKRKLKRVKFVVIASVEADGYLCDLSDKYAPLVTASPAYKAYALKYELAPYVLRIMQNLSAYYGCLYYYNSLETTQVTNTSSDIIDLTESSDNSDSSDHFKSLIALWNMLANQRVSERQLLSRGSSMAESFKEPTTLLEVRAHPKYILKRDLKWNEVIQPDAIEAFQIKGESVFLKEEVEALKTRSQWIKVLRTVKNDLAPIKSKKRKLLSGNQVTVDLFALWQTIPFIPLEVKDGIIPVNEHGNVEIWDGIEALVPRGTVWINNDNALKAAKSLAIPFAPVVIGFDTRNSRNVARYDGVVTLTMYESLLSEAADNITQEMTRRAETKRENAILEKWKTLVRGILIHQKNREAYGLATKKVIHPI